MTIKTIIDQQRQFFNTNQTKSSAFRVAQLKKLKHLLKSNEEVLYEAIYKDFAKSSFETYATELSIIYHELNLLIKKVPKWSKPIKVRTNLANFPAKSYIIPEPLGVSLVIGAWNYPYQLSFLPALTALAAGNTVILKPSELPLNTSKVMAQLINDHFPAEYFHVVEGGVPETTELLKQPFDKIFFTGSIPVGKIVYEAAAKHLTPVTLELGGKSPAFILADAKLKMTVKRLVWAKFLNAGQTCVAPDYVLVDKSIENDFLLALKAEIKSQFPIVKQITENYVQIINDQNFLRLQSLLESHQNQIFYGGQMLPEKRLIVPTVLKDINFDDDIMKDEIFGPILPVIAFDNLDEAIQQVKNRPKPLALYVYGQNRKLIRKILDDISFGGGAVNESVMHLTNSYLPFGGVGSSGMGSYHGKVGFDAFTHYKSVLDKPTWLEFDIKYAPYTKLKRKLLKFLLE
jgi:aldehyde dehydrogenase (NAD+)